MSKNMTDTATTGIVFDIQHFEDIKNKYNVMSVPCLIINDNKVFFGKKNINQIIELISDIKN